MSKSYYQCYCEYIDLCRNAPFNGLCIKNFLGEELRKDPNYSPKAIAERMNIYFVDRKCSECQCTTCIGSKYADCLVCSFCKGKQTDCPNYGKVSE